MAGEQKRVCLSDVATLRNGAGVKQETFAAAGVPLARVSDFTDWSVDLSDCIYVAPACAARWNGHRLTAGEVLVATVGSWPPNWSSVVGKTVRVPESAAGAIQNQNTCCVLARPGVADQQFLFYRLRSAEFVHYAATSAAGSASQARLPVANLERFAFGIPPLSRQRRIAHILGALDDKIELNRKMNATLEAMVRALFKSWFVDFDPVRARAEGRAPSGMDAETAKMFPSELVESEVGPIPKGWRATTLGAEVERSGGAIQTGPFGSQLHASDYVPEGVPVVMPKDIGGRRVSTSSIARVREVDAGRLSRHRLQQGDIVYSRRGDVERHALIGAREVGWLCGTGCLLVRLGPNWPSSMFASFALDRPERRAWISQHAIGATMPNLNTGILSAVPLVMPSDDVLRAFARAVDPLQALVVIRDAEAGLLASARDRLLPPLLSGELFVGHAEREAEAVA